MCVGPLSVVDAGPTHVSVLTEMHAACFEEPWGAVFLQTLLNQPGIFGIIVQCSEQPAGFGLCRVAGDEGEILTCCVMPHFRGHGVGRLMMTSALNEAERRGALCVFLEVAESNVAARRLYTALGMRAIGRRPRYYRRAGGQAEDALIFRGDS